MAELGSVGKRRFKAIACYITSLRICQPDVIAWGRPASLPIDAGQAFVPPAPDDSLPMKLVRNAFIGPHPFNCTNLPAPVSLSTKTASRSLMLALVLSVSPQFFGSWTSLSVPQPQYPVFPT